MANLFGSRAWYKLVPDQTHVLVTGGYGQFVSGGLIAGNNYVTSAVTPDGSLGMAYLPQGGTITVAMTKLRNTVTARWFDPSANTFTTIAGSPFPNTGTQNFTSPGSNSAGDPDWVLLLEAIEDPPKLQHFPHRDKHRSCHLARKYRSTEYGSRNDELGERDESNLGRKQSIPVLHFASHRPAILSFGIRLRHTVAAHLPCGHQYGRGGLAGVYAAAKFKSHDNELDQCDKRNYSSQQ